MESQQVIVRVVRVLVIEGPEAWVNDILDRALVQPNRPFTPDPHQPKAISEVVRNREIVRVTYG